MVSLPYMSRMSRRKHKKVKWATRVVSLDFAICTSRDAGFLSAGSGQAVGCIFAALGG